MSRSAIRSASAAVLLLFSGAAAFALADEAPSITAITANGPGVVTIKFDQRDLFGLHTLAAQQKIGSTWQDAPTQTHGVKEFVQEKFVTVTFLEPNTEHALRLCAVYGPDRERDWHCSGERHVRTPPLPAGGARNPVPAIVGHEATETGLRVHVRAASNYEFYQLRWKQVARGPEKLVRSITGGTAASVEISGLRDGTEHQITIQGCTGNPKAPVCSALSAPYRATTAFGPLQTPQLDLARYPNGDRLDTGPNRIALVYIGAADFKNTNVTLQRDGVLVHDARAVGGIGNPLTDSVPRPNKLYRYQLCFVRGESVCSQPLETRPPPVVPTAPEEPRVSITRKRKLLRMGPPVLEAAWRNTDVPGAYVTLEQGEGNKDAAGFRWTELTRVEASNDPTTLSVEMPKLRTGEKVPKGAYRVCSVVPELGDKGRACSGAVSP